MITDESSFETVKSGVATIGSVGGGSPLGLGHSPARAAEEVFRNGLH